MIYEASKRADLAQLLLYLREYDWKAPLKIEVKTVRLGRTLTQNATLWHWCGELAEHFGLTKDDVHDVLCMKFLGYVEVSVEGEVFRRLRTTTSPRLDVGEMYMFLRSVYDWALSVGVFLTVRSDSDYAQYDREQRGG